jgi:GntR family transcriptional regulator of vanillate catabolism
MYTENEATQVGRSVLTLRELILKGHFAPGEHLSESQLVARLGVSRTPVREALGRLAHEGLVYTTGTGRYRVREFTMSDVLDAIELRGVLEGTAARLAAERLIKAEELEAIRGVQARLDEIKHITVDTFGAYMELNESFHVELVSLAKSAMLRRSVEHVNTLPFASPSALVFARSKLPRATEMVVVGHEQHHAIIDAVERRQGARAEAVAREHAQLSRRNLEISLADEHIRNYVPGSPLILA